MARPREGAGFLLQTHWELGLRRNCGTWARRALGAVTLALWAEQAFEDATDPQWLSRPLDNLVDCAMVTLSIALVVWSVHAYFAKLHAEMRRRDEQVQDLTAFAAAACQRIDGGTRATPPLAVVQREKGA